MAPPKSQFEHSLFRSRPLPPAEKAKGPAKIEGPTKEIPTPAMLKTANDLMERNDRERGPAKNKNAYQTRLEEAAALALNSADVPQGKRRDILFGQLVRAMRGGHPYEWFDDATMKMMIEDSRKLGQELHYDELDP